MHTVPQNIYLFEYVQCISHTSTQATFQFCSIDNNDTAGSRE